MSNFNEIFFLSSSTENLNIKIITEEKKHSLYYQNLKNNKPVSTTLLSDKVLTTPFLVHINNDCLYIFYKDLNYNIILHKYSNNTWTSITLIENDSEYLIFQPIKLKDKVLLFSQNYDETKKTSYLFYQTLNPNLSLSAPTLIDKIDFKSNLLDVKTINESIYIFYLKFELNYLLGFKTLDFTNKKLTSFQTLSSFKDLYSNYDISVNENIFSIQYQKEDPTTKVKDAELEEKKIIIKDTTSTDNNLELPDTFPIADSTKNNSDLPSNTKTVQISNLTRENLNLQKEVSSLKRKLEMANNRLTLFYKQLSKFLE
ncbi:MAG: hypothetical protein ACRDCW_18210 [Sarcina sp.]